MGSSRPEQGGVALRVSKGIEITPRPPDGNAERESWVDAERPADLGSGVRLAVLVGQSQQIARFAIRQADNTYYPPERAATEADDRQILDEWMVTAPGKQWHVFFVPSDRMPPFPWRTQFRLAPPNQGDVLWVAVLDGEGFGMNHGVYGWTEYPRQTAPLTFKPLR